MGQKNFRTGHSLSRISYDSTIIEIVKDKKRPVAWAFWVGHLGCLKIYSAVILYSAVTVGRNAHPISTCGAFGGLKIHPTAFLYSFRQPEKLRFHLPR